MTVTEVNGRDTKGNNAGMESRNLSGRFLGKGKGGNGRKQGKWDKIVSIITEYARTGSIGDEKIFTLPVEEEVRIRTEERKKEAL